MSDKTFKQRKRPLGTKRKRVQMFETCLTIKIKLENSSESFVSHTSKSSYMILFDRTVQQNAMQNSCCLVVINWIIRFRGGRLYPVLRITFDCKM